jgi:hypothetical protein
LDESAFNWFSTRRKKGWAYVLNGMIFLCEECGMPAVDQIQADLKSYSILPAICLDCVLHCDILTCSWDADAFRTFLDVLLDRMNPYPQPNSVVVMDNASIHKFEGIEGYVEER